MDVLWFLHRRTQTLRHYYETAAQPFEQTKQRIENKEPPYDNGEYDESGEPPFMEEWNQATECLDLLGRSCISLLSASMQLYFRTWERELGFNWTTTRKRRQFLWGYRSCFEELLGCSFECSGADLGVIEQVALARDEDQHPEHISSIGVYHSQHAREKYPRPFFLSEFEQKMYADEMWQKNKFFPPRVSVSHEQLVHAIEQVERLADWLDPLMWAKKYGTTA